MKALIFNHHPDYTYHIWAILKSLNIDVYLATEKCTLKCGTKVSSTKGEENLFQFITLFLKPEELYPDMVNLKFSDTTENFDAYFTINPELAFNSGLKKLVYGTVIQPHFKSYYDPSKFLKICSTQNASDYKAKYLQYFVSQRGIQKNKKYISQLVSDFRSVPTTNEMMNLKNRGLSVIIGGFKDAPDGIVNDIEILEDTALLVHEKNWGTNCNAVCKALDMGVPVYMSRETKKVIGFNDLPDFMFIYKDNYTIEQAYEIALKKDPSVIQKAYRKLRNVELSRIYMYDIINSL